MVLIVQTSLGRTTDCVRRSELQRLKSISGQLWCDFMKRPSSLQVRQLILADQRSRPFEKHCFWLNFQWTNSDFEKSQSSGQNVRLFHSTVAFKSHEELGKLAPREALSWGRSPTTHLFYIKFFFNFFLIQMVNRPTNFGFTLMCLPISSQCRSWWLAASRWPESPSVWARCALTAA